MNESALCPACGASIPADAPEGVCPVCALGRGLGVEAAAEMAKEEAAFRRAEMETLASSFPQFELIEMLGRGGMGEVYKARQKKLNRLVAIKILPEPFGRMDEFTQRFLREAQSLARLNHPNIVTIYDYGEANGLCYFVMEFVDGVDLRRTIEAGTLTPADALRIVPQICDALQFAHDHGIVHRDIKPANILIDKRGGIKIADFGLVKIMGRNAHALTLTSTGGVMGTPEYMAPEQRQAAQPVDHRADIYSLGVVFYEMLTGEVPMGKFDPPSKRVQIDVRLDDVVLRTLEREPERRYQKASEVKSGVETICASAPVRVPRPPGAIPRGHRFPPAFAALATLLFAVMWFATDALWDLRWPGVVLNGVLVFVALYGVTALGRRWFPIIGTNWKNDSLPAHVLRLATTVAQCIVGFYLVLGGMLALKERANWRFGYRDAESFVRLNQGQEYRLVRQLTALAKSIPKVELVPHGSQSAIGMAFFGNCSASFAMFPMLGVIVQFGAGFVLLANAANALVATTLWKPRPHPTWRLYVWPIAVISIALVASWCVHQFALFVMDVTQMSGGIGRSNVAQVKAPLDEVRKRVEQAVVAEGFSFGESGEWLMDTVPEGQDIGEAALANAWKTSPFDRWRWRRGSLASSAPQVQLLFLASDQPAETKVAITLTWPNFDPDPAATEALLNRLLKAAKSWPASPGH